MASSWAATELGEVIEILDSKRIPLSSRERQQRQGAFPYYGAQGIIDHIDDYIFDGQFILVAEDGENLNSRKLPLALMASGKFWVNNHAHIIRSKPGVSDDIFLLHSLNCTDIKPYVTGAAQPKLSQANMRLIKITLPPLPIQRRIAGILSAYDALIENSQRRIKILEEMARRLYREWFVHFRFPGYEGCRLVESPLGEIPERWEVAKLEDISSYINRGITPSYDEMGDSVVLNQKCVRHQRLNLEPARRQIKPIPPEKQIRFGDVLINSTGVGTLGRVAQVYTSLESCTVDTHVTIARAAPDLDLDFYGCCLLGNQEVFERLGVGATGQTELSRNSIASIELVMPPSALQCQFGAIVSGLRLSAEIYLNQVQNLRRTRDMLLPRLLSGLVDIEALPNPDLSEP